MRAARNRGSLRLGRCTMQRTSAKNRKFLEDYNDVVRHHVECILKSGMILDEDMNLLLTFWDPSLVPSATSMTQQFLLTSTTCATAGLLTSFKFQSAYPVTISLIPAVLHFVSRALHRYHERTFKTNFVNLLKVLGEIYRLNKEILLYYCKRDLAVQDKKLQLEAYNLLLKPGENFLQLSTSELAKIIESIRHDMAQVCELVPISEGQFVCSSEWNLYNYDSVLGDGFHETKGHFEKLTDVYLLITSNFLGRVGLCMCVQLWREPCNFQIVFTHLIPSLTSSLRRSYDNMHAQFGIIRFNLSGRTMAVQKSECSVVASCKFSKPLHEFLLHLQNGFDKGRHLQLLLEDQRTNSDYEEFVNILEEAWKNVEVSRDCLRVLTRRIEAVIGRSGASTGTISLPTLTRSVDVVEATTLEDLPELKDEEYNLSVHGSDDGCVDHVEDFEDLSAHEDFSILLLELKKKLQDRQVKVHDETPIRVVPEKIPVVDHSRDINSLLKSVMLTAQKLTRSEEVFGSGSISNSDSDDS